MVLLVALAVAVAVAVQVKPDQVVQEILLQLLPHKDMLAEPLGRKMAVRQVLVAAVLAQLAEMLLVFLWAAQVVQVLRIQ